MVTRVSPTEAWARMQEQGYVYVDVRSERELDQGVVPGAYHVPLQLLTDDGLENNRAFLPVMRACFPLDTKLVIGCATGVRSLRAATLLSEAGYPDVVDQRAGFDGVRDAFGRVREPGWRASGLPVADAIAEERRYEALSQRSKAT